HPRLGAARPHAAARAEAAARADAHAAGGAGRVAALHCRLSKLDVYADLTRRLAGGRCRDDGGGREEDEEHARHAAMIARWHWACSPIRREEYAESRQRARHLVPPPLAVVRGAGGRRRGPRRDR